MTDYETNRTHNPNRKGPQDSCERCGTSFTFTKRRYRGHRDFNMHRVWCPCKPRYKASDPWYHNREQAIEQHRRWLKKNPVELQLEFLDTSEGSRFTSRV